MVNLEIQKSAKLLKISSFTFQFVFLEKIEVLEKINFDFELCNLRFRTLFKMIQNFYYIKKNILK